MPKNSSQINSLITLDEIDLARPNALVPKQVTTPDGVINSQVLLENIFENGISKISTSLIKVSILIIEASGTPICKVEKVPNFRVGNLQSPREKFLSEEDTAFKEAKELRLTIALKGFLKQLIIAEYAFNKKTLRDKHTYLLKCVQKYGLTNASVIETLKFELDLEVLNIKVLCENY